MNAQIIFEKREDGKMVDGIYKFAVLDSGLSSGLGTSSCKGDQEIHMMIDTSGSMDELCSDKNTKLDQIKFVIRNMIRYIVEHSQNCGVILSVSSFNQCVKPVITSVRVEHENMDALFKQIDTMYATDQTNIEIALEALRLGTIKTPTSSAIMNERGGAHCDCSVNSIHNKHNIFMSDGEANSGITDPLKLAELVDSRAFNTFIGFGLEHDPYMFSTLSATQNSKYYFISDKEKAGIAYGEILHGILNNVWSNVVLVCRGIQVYDYKTDTWVSTLYIGQIAASDTRTFHIRRLAEDTEPVNIYLMTGDSVICDTHFEDKFDHMPEMAYRLKTLQMLYKASNFTKHHKEQLITDLDDVDEIEIDTQDGVKEIKAEMKALLKEMRMFMDAQKDIRFMKNLCDDIVVVLRTIGTSYGHMFSCSRQHSQGDERVHNTTMNGEINELFNTPLCMNRMAPSRLTRQHTNTPVTVDLYSTNTLDTSSFRLEGHEFGSICWGHPDGIMYSLTPRQSPSSPEDTDDDIDDYVVSNEVDSPYCTDDKMFVIRSVSSKPEDYDDNANK